MPTTSLLVILDGFGHSTNTENNAIAMANMPTWDDLWGNHPHTLISGSGIDVGLPDGQMGNSEVGHMNLGSGRVVYQDFTRINKSIEDGDFADNTAIVSVTDSVTKSGGALHVMGLLSPGGVHSHEEQIFSLIKVAAAKGIKRIYLHAFLDGRDTPPRSAKNSLDKADALFSELQCGQVISVSGRYFAMDRDHNWDRLERAYNLLARGEAPFHATSGVEALEKAYARDENDEFVQPTAIHAADNAPFYLSTEDAVVFMNFRADRARQITRAMTEADFDGFPRRSFIQPANFTTLTQYAEDINLPCAFSKLQLVNSFGEHLQNKGMKKSGHRNHLLQEIKKIGAAFTTPQKKSSTSNSSSGKRGKRGPYKKSPPVPLTKEQQDLFDEWFPKRCKVVENTSTETFSIGKQMRYASPHSYNNYCEEKGVKQTKMGCLQFNQAIRDEMGYQHPEKQPRFRHDRKKCFDRIQFDCCSESSTSSCPNYYCPNGRYKK